jgi:2-dehydro-3-deoxygluconokinase
MKKVVTFGEIMMRLATPDHLRFGQTTSLEATYGGAESNVAVSLANFGLYSTYVTRLPANDFGGAAIAELKKHDVNTKSIVRGGDRIGIYFLESGAVGRGSKVVYDRANSALATIQPGMIDWDAVFEGADWFHWTGITPAVSESAAAVCKEAVQKAAEKGLTISTDLNFRAKLWKWGKSASEVMEELVSYCDVILGNEEDAEKVFGIEADGDVTAGHVEASAYQSVCEQLMVKFPKASKIIITLRGSISASHNTWSGVLWNGEKLLIGKEYNITHIVDRVGGGDAFMGGLIYGLNTWSNDDEKALNFAIAASCLKHTIKGDFNLVTKEEVEKLMAGDGSGRVAR